MLLHVPVSLDGLLSLCAGCFTQPSFQTFRAMVLGQVSRTGRRTVCGMLVGARLSGVWEHSRAHRFFSRARWDPDQLGLALAALIVERFVAEGEPVTVAVDDTLLQRWGRKVYGCFYHHHATANSEKAAVAWGNNWVVVGICVTLPFLERTVCLPVLFRLWRPRRGEYAKIDKPDPDRPGKPAMAREMVCLLAARLPGRRIDVVGDAAYASEAWRGVPDRVTVTSRLRVKRRDLPARAEADGQAWPAPQMGQTARKACRDRDRPRHRVGPAHRPPLREDRDATAAHDRLLVGAAGSGHPGPRDPRP